MSEKFEQIFNNLKNIEPSSDLFDRVLQRIQEEKRLLSIRRRIFIFSSTLLISGIAGFFAIKSLFYSFSESGFLTFVSLLFSDYKIVLGYWQNFAMSILERLPVMSLALVILVFIVFLEALKNLSLNLKVLINSHNKLKIWM